MVKSGVILALSSLVFAICLTIEIYNDIKTQRKIGNSWNYIYKDCRLEAIVNVLAYLTTVWIWNAAYIIFVHLKGVSP